MSSEVRTGEGGEGSPLLGGGGGGDGSPSSAVFNTANQQDTSRRRNSRNYQGTESSMTMPTTATTSVMGEVPVRQRWLLLFMFCMLAFLQNAVFVEFNPIAISAKCVFPTWKDATFAWQVNFATITSPIVQWPAWWAIQKFGLSRTLRWGAVFPLFLSSLLTALPLAFSGTSSDDYMICTYAAYLLIGVTGVVFFSSITRFSGLWFPSEQRATATGLTITCANMGSLLPALSSPLIVSDPMDKNFSSSTNCNSTQFDDDNKQEIRSEIFSYFLMYLGLSTVLMTVFLVYFPSEKPARRNGGAENQDDVTTRQLGDLRIVLKTFAKLMSKPRILFIMTLQALSSIPFIWGVTLLTVTLTKPLNIDQKTVSGLIIVTTLVAALTTVFISRIADLCFRFRLKVLTLILLVLHAAFTIGLGVCALRSHDTSWSNKAMIFIFYVASISLLNASSPLMYELTAEMSYPITEEFLGGLLNQFNNLVGVLFYVAFSQLSNGSGHDFTWLFYVLMVTPTVVTLAFFFVGESYNRSDATSSGMMIVTDAGTEAATAFLPHGSANAPANL